jgi:hypothetical protein
MTFFSPTNNLGWIAKVYFGVPQRMGELFGTTCVSGKVLAVGIIGIPLLAAVLMAAYADIFHSILPVQLLIAGAVQFAIETDSSGSSSVTPALAEAMHHLTPEQLDMSEILFRGSLFVVTVYTSLVVWLLFKAVRFLVTRSNDR